LARRGLAIRERLPGPNQSGGGRRSGGFGPLLDGQGKRQEAGVMMVRALGILERAYGSDDDEVAVSLNNLPALRARDGDRAEAVRLYTQALAIKEGPRTGTIPTAQSHSTISLCFSSRKATVRKRRHSTGAAWPSLRSLSARSRRSPWPAEPAMPDLPPPMRRPAERHVDSPAGTLVTRRNLRETVFCNVSQSTRRSSTWCSYAQKRFDWFRALNYIRIHKP
jgi:hypothetical protein